MAALIREPMTATTLRGPLDVELTYDPADPFAVRLVFPSENKTWIFARDLLLAGGGEGDAFVLRLPGLGVVSVLLWSPNGSLTVHLPTEPVRWFVERSFCQVPRGSESVDIDGLIERLVASW
jgi:hypothetical protein